MRFMHWHKTECAYEYKMRKAKIYSDNMTSQNNLRSVDLYINVQMRKFVPLPTT